MDLGIPALHAPVGCSVICAVPPYQNCLSSQENRTARPPDPGRLSLAANLRPSCGTGACRPLPPAALHPPLHCSTSPFGRTPLFQAVAVPGLCGQGVSRCSPQTFYPKVVPLRQLYACHFHHIFPLGNLEPALTNHSHIRSQSPQLDFFPLLPLSFFRNTFYLLFLYFSNTGAGSLPRWLLGDIVLRTLF
jgi:hypothetical protein